MMKKLCMNCGAEMTSAVETVRHDRQIGLTGVVLEGVTVNRCPSCNEHEVEIPNLEGLLMAIARSIVIQPHRLTGEQIRFLRKTMGYSAVRLAALLGVDQATVSRWENDAQDIGGAAQRVIRLLVVQGQPFTEYQIDWLEKVSQDPPPPPPHLITAHLQGNAWRTHEASAS